MNSDYQPTIDPENDCLNRPDIREFYSSNSESQPIFCCYESGTWIFGYRLLEARYSDGTVLAKKVLRSSARADGCSAVAGRIGGGIVCERTRHIAWTWKVGGVKDDGPKVRRPARGRRCGEASLAFFERLHPSIELILSNIDAR
jgi:hypothetical protein